MIIIKTKKEIDIMRAGGQKLARILDSLASAIKPGVTTGQLEQMALDLIKSAGGRPAFKGYKSMMEANAYPTALCASINNEVVHAPALPSRALKEGDIIGLDLGMEFPFSAATRGYYTDATLTVGVGKLSQDAKDLIMVTRRSLMLGIKQVKAGNSLNDIGTAIQNYVESRGYSVVRDLVGHGIGTAVHEDPQVPNYPIVDKTMENVILKPGMTFAIEPMVNAGSEAVKSLIDGFTIVTEDGSLSAHFEHTVAVTKEGCIVLTEL
jgi:methionyl aminopeptidase